VSFSHVTLATRDVQRTASFLEQTLGYPRDPAPGNIPSEAAWFNLGNGQQIHLVHVEGFEVSPFEQEFGRHIALLHPGADLERLKRRLQDHGAEIIAPMRATPFNRFFFKDPINGYVFEVIDAARNALPATDH
jgi:catechol 2,3-dioxygenase-like lactoylglutathione lyase family enzyme